MSDLVWSDKIEPQELRRQPVDTWRVGVIEQEAHWIQTTGSSHKTITIYAETIKLHQKDLDITIDIPNDFFDKIENIEINGFKFIKEKSDE